MFLNEKISLIVFCVSVIASLIMWTIKKRKNNIVFTNITPAKVFMIGFAVALSAYIFLSYSSIRIIDYIDNGFATFRNVKKYFKLDLTPSEFNKVVPKNKVSNVGSYYLMLLDLIIPAITLKILYTAFRDYLTQWVYIFRRWRKYHIFSDLSDKTICLAEDIFESDKKCTFIFSNVSDKYAEGLLDRAKRINAHFTSKTLVDFQYFKRKNSIYIMSEDDSKNMSDAIKINELLNRKKVDADMYVLSSLTTSPEHIDAINLEKENKYCCAHLINNAQIIAYNMLLDYPLFKAADLAQSKKISILVIGAGFIGMEFAKASMWAGLMNKYDYEITIVDAQNKQEDFLSEVGDINKKLYDIGVNINYKYEVADVGSYEFKKLIKEHYDANYIVVALGNDELTVNTSVTLRRELIRACVEKGIYNGSNNSYIIPIVSNEQYSSLLTQLGDDYGFIVYGSNQQIFTYGNIGYSRIDKAAAYINWYYSKQYSPDISLAQAESDYRRTSEINRRSSRAAVVRSIYNLKEAGIECSMDKELKENTVSVDEAEIMLKSTDIQELEHKRWSIFMIMNGWDTWKLRSTDKYISIEKFGRDTHKLTIAKLHGCLVNNSLLADVSKVVPSTGSGDTLKQNDISIVNASAGALNYAFDNIRFFKDIQEN